MTRNQIHSIILGAFVLVSPLVGTLPAADKTPKNHIQRWRRSNNI